MNNERFVSIDEETLDEVAGGAGVNGGLSVGLLGIPLADVCLDLGVDLGAGLNLDLGILNLSL